MTPIAVRGAVSERGRVEPPTVEPTAVAVAALAVLAAAVSWVATTNGAGVTADSVNYFSMARHLGALEPMRGVDGSQLTVFPPGYPALLAAGELAGLTAMEAARVVAALSWSVTVACTAVAVRRRSPQHPWVAVAAAAVVAVAAPLFAVMIMAWSEAPFVAVVMLALVVADRCRGRTSVRRSSIAFLVLVVWAAWMLRYVGIVLVPVGLVALWADRRWRWSFVVGALTVPALWLLRNRAVDGTLMGRRNPSTATLPGELAGLLVTAARWFVPNVAAGALALVGLGALIWLTRTESAPSSRPDMAVWSTFLVGFVAVTIWSRTTTQIDQLGDRLLVPIVAPVVVLMAVFVADALGRSRPGVAASRVLGGAVVGWVVLALLVSLVEVRADHARGASFLAHRFRDSELVGLVQGLPDDVLVVSNQPEALAHLSGRATVLDPPATAGHGWSPADPTATLLLETVACAPTPVVMAWFDVSEPYFVTPEDLPTALEVSLLDTVQDGRLMTLQLDASGPGEPVSCGR